MGLPTSTSLVTATVLLFLAVQTLSFSLFPTLTTPANRETKTSLGLSAPTAERQATELQSKDEADDSAIQKILSTLEKRVQQGPGSLSSTELEEFQAHSERLLMALKQEQAATTADLRAAAAKLDVTKISEMKEAGIYMDEASTETAFWAVVQAVDDAEEQDQPLSADVTRMLHHIFDADMHHLKSREQLRTNVTCMQPDLTDAEVKARSMNYIFDDSAHKDLPLKEGRRCEGGTCCEACSRNIFPTFATDKETSFNVFPDLESFTFNNLKRVPSQTILQFTRLVERVRRTMAYEYGLPLCSLLPLQAYTRKFVAGTTQQGGGGGEGDFITLHTDEATHSGYHYSCVLYLGTQGEDFEGGNFIFNDPAVPGEETDTQEEEVENSNMSLADQMRYSGRKLSPFSPTRGAAVIFSSGWENMHEVDTVTSGIRYNVPCFFTTCPVPEQAYEQMVAGIPKTDEDIADDWLHLLLAHRQETPLEASGRVKELLMKWHYMCTPLSEHNR